MPKKRQAKAETDVEMKPFNARFPKAIHMQAMMFKAKTGMSLQDQVLEGLRLLYAKRDKPS